MKQTLLLMALALGMFCAKGLAQEKEYKVEDDGFEWYKVKRTVNGRTKYVAEDRNGNMIVPTEYPEVEYLSDINPICSGFVVREVKRSGWIGWYNKSGKCIVSYTKGYTDIQKFDDDEFGTYYTFEKPDGFGILDRNGNEVVFVKANNVLYGRISTTEKYEKKFFYLELCIKKGETFYNLYADANGKIIVEAEYDDSTAWSLARSRITTTNNPLANNIHETLAEAEGRPQGGKNNPIAGQQQQQSGGTTTVVVEHHRDPVPVQQWQACFACGGMGTMGCDNCGGGGTKYIGDRLHRCSRCNGRGIIPCNVCYGNKGQYVTVYR